MRCLGCVTSFKESERLTMEDLMIEYKNYNIPLEDKGKRTLLKTIVSFLNSKGGTIFVGVEDNKGEVRGVELTPQSQAAFRECIEDMVQHIRPVLSMKDR